MKHPSVQAVLPPVCGGKSVYSPSSPVVSGTAHAAARM